MSDFENMIRDNEERKRLANEREDDLRSLATAIHSGFASKLGCKAAELRYEFVGLEPNSKNVPTCFEFDLTIVQLGKTLRVVIFHRRDHYDIELWNTHA